MKHLSNNDFNQNRLANVPDGTADQEAVNRRQLDTKVTGDGLQTITVSEAVPISPQDGDLWVNEDDTSTGEVFSVGNLSVTGVGQNYINTGFIPAYIEFEVMYAGSSTPATSTGYYDAINDTSFSMYTAFRFSLDISRFGTTTSPVGTLLVGSDGNTMAGLMGTVTISGTGFNVNVTTKNGAAVYSIIWKARA